MKSIVIAALLVSGCAAGSAGSRQIRDVEWAAVDVNGVPVTGTAPTMRLGQRASGHGGCNSWSADYDLRSRDGIRFGPVAATKMACAPEVMEQERRFLTVVEYAQGYSVYGDGSLSLIAGDGRAVRFRRAR
ncbi:MAG: META domain-containing protein [Allosphingosinicella sp.]